MPKRSTARAGYGVSQILLDIVITGAINLIFTLVAMAFVDRWAPAAHAHRLRRHRASRTCSPDSRTIGLARDTRAGADAVRHRLLRHDPGAAHLGADLGNFPQSPAFSGVSVAVSALWISSFALTYSFPFMNRALGSAGPFFTYGVICRAGGVFVYFFVPETKGRTLEEIEAETTMRG